MTTSSEEWEVLHERGKRLAEALDDHRGQLTEADATSETLTAWHSAAEATWDAVSLTGDVD